MRGWKSLALLLGVLAGCDAAKLVKRGDASMLAGEPAQAVRYYEQALAKKPELARDEKFAGGLNRARCLAAYQEGTALGRKGEWEKAVEKFSECLRFDPEFEEARQALPQAKREASRTRHKRALQLADQGQLAEAMHELRRALELDPGNTDAKQALESVDDSRNAPPTRGQELYERASALVAEKRFQQASELLLAAIKLDPNDLPCRVSRHRCQQTLEQAGQTHSTGRRLMKEKRLDQAVATLQEALNIWPFHPDAPGDLAAARTLRAEAQRHYERAAKLAGEARWDEAAVASAASLEIYPFHEPAAALSRRVHQKAAEAHGAAGNGLLEAGRLVEARAEFLTSVGYVPDFAGARQGLARVYGLWGQAAEIKGLWGSALLWHLEAADSAPAGENAARVRAARAKILERIAFGLDLDVKGVSGTASVKTEALKSEVLRWLDSQRPPFVALVSGETRLPVYAVAVKMAGLDVDQRLVRTESRTHRYTVQRKVPNPEIPKLRQLLIVARGELARLKQPCPACGGKARRPCPTCKGSGTVPCATCRATGKVDCRPCRGTGWKDGDRAQGRCPHCGGTGKAKCEVCQGSGKTFCPACSTAKLRRGWVPCRECGGTGRASRASESDIRRKEGEVRALEQKLVSEPASVARDFPADWPYVVEHYEKTGAVDAGIRITRRGESQAVAATSVSKAFRRGDSTISNANPAVGLAAEPLNLPSDAEVRRQLLQEAASEASAWILSAVLGARVAEVRAGAAEFSRQGKTADATEANADLVHLLGAHDAAASADLLRRLRDEQRQGNGADVKAVQGAGEGASD